MQLHVTTRCNLRCTHCYGRYGTTVHDLPLITIEKVLAEWSELCDVYPLERHVHIAGGEPLLRSDIEQILEAAGKLDYQVSIGTNGTLIDRRMSKIIADNVDEVAISIEGGDKINKEIRGVRVNTYARAVDRLRSEGADKISLNSTLHQTNFGDREFLMDFAECLGLNLGFHRLTPIGRGERLRPLTKEQYSEVCHEIKDRHLSKTCSTCNVITLGIENIPCLIGKTLVIDGDGSILPCARLRVKLGNVLRKGSIKKVFESSNFLWKFRDFTARGKCSACKYLERCYGCRAVAKAINGTSFSEDPQCFYNPILVKV